MNNILTIDSKLQDFNGISENINTNGFIFSRNNENYIVSVHHGLPISKCKTETYNLKIIQDCIWNELLLLKSNTELNNTYTNYKKIKYKIPNIDEELYIKLNDKIITLRNIIAVNMYLYDIPTNPKIIYYKLDIYDGDVEESMSGSPVFDKNNYLVGILSKKDNSDKTVYIIPSYILIKSLTKNNGIFDIDSDDISCYEDIKKINDIKTKNNLILHKSMNIMIPINVYFLIEGNIETSIKINDKFYRFNDVSNELLISNTNSLLVHNKNYELTIRLLKLLKLYFNEISNDVFKILKENFKNKIILNINNKRVPETLVYHEFNVIFNSKNINLKFVIDI